MSTQHDLPNSIKGNSKCLHLHMPLTHHMYSKWSESSCSCVCRDCNSVQPTQSNQIYEWREDNSYICITVAAQWWWNKNKLARVQYYYFILLFFSDHCVWWASHRLQKPHRSEQSHQSGKNPAVSLLARMIKPSCAHREIPSLYFQGDYTFKVLPPKYCLCCIFWEHSSQSFTFIRKHSKRFFQACNHRKMKPSCYVNESLGLLERKLSNI